MARDRRELVVIYWRDIPAQVNAQVGRERHQVLLPPRFQRAIDRAKRKAGITTADDDVAQWRRESRLLRDDPVGGAEAEAARLAEAFPKDTLGRLAFVGGFHDDVQAGGAIGAAELAALEELDDERQTP